MLLCQVIRRHTRGNGHCAVAETTSDVDVTAAGGLCGGNFLLRATTLDIGVAPPGGQSQWHT